MSLPKLCTCFLLLLSFNAFAQYAQHRDYIGGGLTRGDLGFFGEDFALNVFDLRMGVEMRKWLHIEGRVGFGLNDKAVNNVEVSIHRLLGVYAVVSYPNKSIFRPYALAGISYGEVNLRVPGLGRGEVSETDLSYGVGGDIRVSDGLDLFIEYVQYIDKNAVDFSGIGLGLKFDF